MSTSHQREIEPMKTATGGLVLLSFGLYIAYARETLPFPRD